jgi:hypothetical protein
MTSARLFSLLLALAATVLSQHKMPPEILSPDFTNFRDVLQVDRAHFRKDLDNDQYRVLRLNLRGDDSVPLHDANDAVFICISRECHLRFTDPIGHVQDLHLETGQTRWVGAGTRTGKNLSTHELEMLIVEAKQRRSP